MLYCRKWQADFERRASIRSCALGADRSTVKLDEVSDDREAEAAMSPRTAGVGLLEPLEDMRQELWFDPDPGVRHLDLDLRFDPFELNRDGAALLP